MPLHDERKTAFLLLIETLDGRAATALVVCGTPLLWMDVSLALSLFVMFWSYSWNLCLCFWLYPRYAGCAARKRCVPCLPLLAGHFFFSKCQALFNTSYVTIDRSRFFTPSSFGHIVRIVLDRRHKYRKYAKENGLTPSKRQICASNLSLPMKFSVSRKVTCGTASLHC